MAMMPTGNDPQRLMDRLIAEVGELHSSPVVVSKILALLRDPEFEICQVEKLLETDPALAAAILRLVNSSWFGLAQKVLSLRQAITLLGVRSLRLTVLSFGLVDRLTRGAPAKVCADYWRRALTMAAAASQLCAERSGGRPDEAYAAGLLADVGVLALAQLKTEPYVQLHERHRHGQDLVEAERLKFGFDHAALGARLLAHWRLPPELTRAVRRHHAPRCEGPLLEQAVLAGDLLADVLWEPQSSRVPEAQRLVQDQFGLDVDGFISLVLKCKADIDQSAELFRVELAGTIDCEEIRRSALRQYRNEALEIAVDMDSVAAIMDQEFECA